MLTAHNQQEKFKQTQVCAKLKATLQGQNLS
jgi:hypothetical protein